MKPRASFRDLLAGSQKPVVLPGVYNAFTAKQAAAMNFSGLYLSGAALSNSLGVPDNGTLGLDEFAWLGRWIVQAVDLPVLCDADTGFEDIEVTIRRYIETGFAGIQIEDQVFPKRCGHLQGKEVVPAEEMVSRLKQAVAVRNAMAPDFLIVARTDARGADNVDVGGQLDECIDRGNRYREAGADVIFPEALKDENEFARVRKEVAGPLLANMTEFGQTPLMGAREFSRLGYDFVIFPVSLFRFHAGCTKRFFSTLSKEGSQESRLSEMMNRKEINGILNYEP
ncbi:isocitrate lyase/PEP mutase family protein [Nitrospina gracilis]|uniref:isocitrate lyase/PEP mutase family protein n=1 Tax=Nitrospina gracilis TaxID=35801 RepID=UPI001F176B84|nr:isocitrate lyase/phosphoenolpyruvate mutase family protein [Nitrospina gracilis]MCF8721626.1 methylisocitrate lyase [Nitrospina gracilis Nb-211]